MGKYIYISEYTLAIKEATGLDLNEDAILEGAKAANVPYASIKGRTLVDRDEMENNFHKIIDYFAKKYSVGIKRRRLGQVRHNVFIRSAMARLLIILRAQTTTLNDFTGGLNKDLGFTRNNFQKFTTTQVLEYLEQFASNEMERRRVKAVGDASRYVETGQTPVNDNEVQDGTQASK